MVETLHYWREGYSVTTGRSLTLDSRDKHTISDSLTDADRSAVLDALRKLEAEHFRILLSLLREQDSKAAIEARLLAQLQTSEQRRAAVEEAWDTFIANHAEQFVEYLRQADA